MGRRWPREWDCVKDGRVLKTMSTMSKAWDLRLWILKHGRKGSEKSFWYNVHNLVTKDRYGWCH